MFRASLATASRAFSINKQFVAIFESDVEETIEKHIKKYELNHFQNSFPSLSGSSYSYLMIRAKIVTIMNI